MENANNSICFILYQKFDLYFQDHFFYFLNSLNNVFRKLVSVDDSHYLYRTVLWIINKLHCLLITTFFFKIKADAHQNNRKKEKIKQNLRPELLKNPNGGRILTLIYNRHPLYVNPLWPRSRYIEELSDLDLTTPHHC